MMTMAPTYFIQRSDPTDPASALIFFPEKGSDELHDALRAAFPHLGNLQARMRQAVIGFYLAEQEQEAFAQFSSPEISDHTSPDYGSFDSSMPLFTTDMSFPNTPALSNEISPELFSFPLGSLPSDMPSLFPATPVSTAASVSVSPAPSSSQQSTIPTQEQLSNVWALPSRPDAKVHKRRCMTEDEKLAYKKKRLQGACSDCKRRRRKCQHNSERLLQSQAIAALNASGRRSALRHESQQQLRGSRPAVVHDRPLVLQPIVAPQHAHVFTPASRQLRYEPLETLDSGSRSIQDHNAIRRHNTLPSTGLSSTSQQLQVPLSSPTVQDRVATYMTLRSSSGIQPLAAQSLQSQTTSEVVHDRIVSSRIRQHARHEPVFAQSQHRQSSTFTAQRHGSHGWIQPLSELRKSVVSRSSTPSSEQWSLQQQQHNIDLAGLTHLPRSHALTSSLDHKCIASSVPTQAQGLASSHSPAASHSKSYIPKQRQSFQRPYIQNGDGLSRSAIEATMTALCRTFLPQIRMTQSVGCRTAEVPLKSLHALACVS